MKTVVYATDEKYAGVTTVSLHSLAVHNPGTHVIVLTDGISPSSREAMQESCAGTECRVTLVDVSPTLRRIQETGVRQYYSYMTYIKLFIPEIVYVPRVVYLDGDTLVTGDISELFSFDLGGKAFAVGYDCLRTEYKYMLGLDKGSPYYNTGVIVFDTDAWNESGCTDKAVRQMRGMPDKAMFADQDVIALALSDRAAVLPPRYNFLTHFQMFRTARDVCTIMGIPRTAWYGDGAYKRAQEAPAIYHFLGNTLGRPWFVESLNPMRSTYVQYAEEAGVPWVCRLRRKNDTCYRVQYALWRTMPYRLFTVLCHLMYRLFFAVRYGI